MAKLLTCPDLDQLQAIALGVWSDDAADAVIAHLEQCPSCAARLSAIVAEDPLVEAVRTGATIDDSKDKQAVSSLVEKVRALVSSPKNTDPTVDGIPQGSWDTGAFSWVDPPASDATEDDGLAPPAGPDEIGRLGSYRVLKVLGEGGMGKVFLAEDPNLQRSVALKVMKASLARNSQARQRFLREARLAAKIEHDHIVHIYQVGEDRGIPFLAMQLLKGAGLEDILQRSTTLKIKQAMRIGTQIAEGLAAAHAHGLIHRDIKPANIWIEPAGGGRVKILDFGLARTSAGEIGITQSGAILGTPAYMSPEQARSDKVDHRCDLYSLGCVLYRMVTGELPLKGNDTMAMLMALALNEPAPPAKINPEIPQPLSDLIMKLLAKDPEQRWGSAQEVVQALRAIEQGCPMSAPNDSALVSASLLRPASELPMALVVDSAPSAHPVALPPAEPARRKSRLIMAALLLGLLLGGGALATIVFYWQTNNGIVRIEVVAVAPTKDDWLKRVAAMPAEKQVQAVAEKLKERNPGFDGKVTPQVDKYGRVVGLRFLTDHVTDLAPVRALTKLQVLACQGSDPQQGKLTDLTPLKGLPLTVLDCNGNPIDDLTPLKDMKLVRFWCHNSRVADLAPLKDMPLEELNCGFTPVSDLTPLKNMPLTSLYCSPTQVADLTPLQGLKLTYLNVGDTPVADLAPLKDMPLTWLCIWGTQVTTLTHLKHMKLTELNFASTKVSDLSPLKDMPLMYLYCSGTQVSDLTPLKDMKTLSVLSSGSTAIADLTPVQNLKLAKMFCDNTLVSTLAPLRDMDLTTLYCWNTKVADLTPLKRMPLQELGCDFNPKRDTEILRSIKTLTMINERPAAEFWREVEAKK